MALSERTRAVLLDIEGTTTRFPFVHQVLFPYARAHMREFIMSDWSTPAMLQIWVGLDNELTDETAAPPFDLSQPAGTHAYLDWLMDQDRKSPALKQVQGLIWQRGYESGALRGEVFPDVAPALMRWQEIGVAAAIYSSGSVLSQQLLFSSTLVGDLTPMLSGFFDTAAGAKTERASYARIAEALSLAPESILFVSDAPAELEAARDAGMAAVMCIRAGNPNVVPPDGIAAIHSFDEL